MTTITVSPKQPRAADVAAVFGVAPKTVLAWAKRGIIHSYRIGHSTFFDWNEIRTVLAKNRYLCGVRRPAPSFTGWDIANQPSAGRTP